MVLKRKLEQNDETKELVDANNVNDDIVASDSADDDDELNNDEPDDDELDDNEPGDDEPDDESDADQKDFRKRIKSKYKKADKLVDELNLISDGLANPFQSDGSYRNKQRVLLFSSRGVGSRYRHLLEDLRKLIPHHKKDVKLDVGRKESLSHAVNAIAEMKSCNNTVFFECRKKKDLYMWVGKTPQGPSAKFHVMNVHTMDELKLTGNCMLGSRPILNFDSNFEKTPHWKLIALLLTDVFGTPRGHPKSKPFTDRVMSFFVADNKIWIRNYQIVDSGDGGSKDHKLVKQGIELTSLVEIGPRFVLTPIRIFSGSFGGPTLYQNGAYVSPNEARSAKKREQGLRVKQSVDAKIQAKARFQNIVRPKDPVNDVFL